MRKLHVLSLGVLLLSTAACADRPTLPVEPETSAAARRLGSTAAVPDAARSEGVVEITRRNKMDLKGHNHVLEFVKQGPRTLSFTHYIEGVRRATITNKWSRENGSWIVTSAEVTFYDQTGGRVVNWGIISGEAMSRHREGIARERRNTALHGASRLFGQVTGLLSPTPLAAQTQALPDGSGSELDSSYFEDPRSYEDHNGYGFEPNPYDPSGLYPYPGGDASFFAAGPNCDSMTARAFAYLVLGSLACGSLNPWACAGAMLGYWATYDAMEAAGCI